jgi:hypothetical protein
MEREHHVTREEIADHLDTLSRVLEDTFGKGAGTIERRAAKRLSARDPRRRLELEEQSISGKF